MQSIPWEDRLISYFDQLTRDKDSIEKTASFMLQCKSDSTRVVCVWYNEFKATVQRQLEFLHVANDLVQKAKKNKAQIFIDLFAVILPFVFFRIGKAMKVVFKANEVIDVLHQRKTFTRTQIQLFRNAINCNDDKISKVIELGNDIPERLLKGLAQNENMPEKLLRNTNSIHLDKKIQSIFKEPDYDASYGVIDDIKEKLDLKLVANLVLQEDENNLIRTLKEDESFSISAAMDLSRIERLYEQFQTIKKTAGETATNTALENFVPEDDKFVYTIDTENSRVELNKLKKLILGQNTIIQAAIKRKEVIMDTLANYQEKLEEKEASINESMNLKTLENLKETKEFNEKLRVKINQKYFEKEQSSSEEKQKSVEKALDNISNQLKSGIKTGWHQFA